jgi:hypothetical protein
MPPHQHSVSIRILLHRLLQTRCKVLLTVNRQQLSPSTSYPLILDILRSVFNNRNPQPIKVSQIPRLPPPFRYPLNLLNLLNLKTRVFAKVTLDQKCNEDCPLGVCMDAAAGTAREGGVEEGCAG